MFKNLTIWLLLILFSLSSYNARALDISITSSNFYNNPSPYVEVYFYVVGSTVTFDSIAPDQWQAGVEVTITFEQDGIISNYDKFILNSPISSKVRDFLAIKRFALTNGKFIMKVLSKDIFDAGNTAELSKEIELDFNPTKTQLSGLQLLASYEKTDKQEEFVKNGFFMEPLAFNYLPQQMDQLAFYLEVYNPKADAFKAAYLTYALYNKTKGSSDPAASIIKRFKKLDGKTIQALILQLPIAELASGNYELMVEVRNRDKMLVDVKAIAFQRSNPMQDLNLMAKSDFGFENSFASKLKKQEVRYALKAIAPLCPGSQSSILEALFFNDELRPKQYFLYTYYVDLLPENPEKAYTAFMEVATAVDRTYRSNVGYGFETDRGVIFLKYGKPSEVVEVEDEPSAAPYEIWFYDRLEESKQYNIKFIFYNPSLANNDYVLLHSNCNGERYNPRWEVELYRNAPSEQVGNSSASTQMQENYRRNARKIWDEL